MVERDIEIPAPDGIADAVLFQPENEGRWPGVIHLTDIVGIRPEHRAMARRPPAYDQPSADRAFEKLSQVLAATLR